MQGLPQGTVTVLFSDIEGSTRLVSTLGERWGEALSTQRAAMRTAFDAHGGREMGTEGDSFFVVFGSASEAVLAAVDGQRALAAERWPLDSDVRVRMGLHSGEPQRHEEGYAGLDVHRGARIAGTAHGGQVVLSDATRHLVGDLLTRSTDIAARDLGWHRLKDLTEPLHLFDLVVGGLPAAFPPLRSLGSRAGLPTPPTSLVGRADEVQSLVDLLLRDEVRLVTVVGPGGTGKTRLGLAAATRLADALPAVFFVSLSGAYDAQAMWSGIADAVAAGRSPAAVPEEQVLDVLAGQSGLLLLDNLEQIPGADEVVATLLGRCPDLRVLATSRGPLHLVAEHQAPLAPLTLPPSDADLATAEASEAVQLFCQRARMVRPSFALTADNVADAVAVCRRLDGLPLALELAAARLHLLGPRALLRRLDTDLGSGPGDRDRPERQRTLQRTIAWSHDLLAPEDQVVFRRLGAFVGGVAIGAVEQVTGLGDVDPLDSVMRLVDAGLVRVADQPDGDPQLSLLHTVRTFAYDRLLASDEAEQVLDRHLAWCVELVEALVTRLQGAAPLAAIDAIDGALPDIRAALGRAMAPGHPERHDAAANLMGHMSVYWHRYRFADEWRSWSERLRTATGDVDSVALVQYLHGAALEQLQEGRHEDGAALLERALGAARRLGDPSLEARSLNSLGVALLVAGDRKGALASLRASLDIAVAIHETSRESTVLSNLAVLSIEEGDYEVGLAQARRAIDLDRAAGDIWSVTLNEVNLTPALVHVDGARAAHAHLVDVAARVPDAGDTDLMADLLDQFVHTLAQLREHGRAAELAGAVDVFREREQLRREPVESRLVERAEQLARAGLGPGGWAEHFAAGQRLDLAAALALATEEPAVTP